MSDLMARLFAPFLRFFFPTGKRRRRASTPYTYRCSCPCSCRYVDGPTVYRTGEPPVRGEDSPLVRPYLLSQDPYLVVQERTLRVGAAA